jgi:hypothetical protein
MYISPIKTILTPWVAIRLAKVTTCYQTTSFLPFMKLHTQLHKRTRQSIQSSAYSVSHIMPPNPLPDTALKAGDSVSKLTKLGSLGMDSVALTEGNNLDPPHEIWQ